MHMHMHMHTCVIYHPFAFVMVYYRIYIYMSYVYHDEYIRSFGLAVSSQYLPLSTHKLKLSLGSYW